MQVTIRALDPANDVDVKASFAVRAAAQVRDVPDLPAPTWADHRGRLTHPWPHTTQHYWLAELDGQPAGTLDVQLPELDNRHMAECDIVVHPDHRRRGIGRALHAHAVAFVRDEGRTTITGNYVTQLPGGPPRDPGFAAFAESVGAKPALPEVRRRLDLGQADSALWDKLYAEALPRAEGYTFLRWTDAVPERYVADIAALESRIVLDVPMGELAWEPEDVDVSRVRAGEQTLRDRGRRCYQVGMVHDASDRLVAWTNITFDADVREHAWQQITIVDPAHRGHRLGLLVKIDNLRHTLASEPDLRVIDTWNAAENAHMIAINEALGFRAVDGWVDCQQIL